VNANFELQQLRQRLLSAGYSDDEADDVCRYAAAEIGDGIADAVADALNEAEQAGLALGALDFMSELQAVPTGDIFQITTDSGRTDFSEPPFPMMSRLLRNAKVAKDGSRYKHIPIENKKAGMPSTSYQVAQDRQAQLEAAKQRLNDEIGKGIQSPDVSRPARAYADAYRQNRQPKHSERRSARSNDVSFKTVSSKQDPSTSWVLPPKEQDMTGTLMNINANLRSSIEEIVRQAIMKYQV